MAAKILIEYFHNGGQIGDLRLCTQREMKNVFSELYSLYFRYPTPSTHRIAYTTELKKVDQRA